MPYPTKLLVRLERHTESKKTKKAAPLVQDPIIKLAIHLNEGVNQALRSLIRYRVDLQVLAIEALESVDLATVTLESVEENMVRSTTISLPRQMHKKLKKIADDRDSSMNILVNTGLAYRLSNKGAITLRQTGFHWNMLQVPINRSA